MLSSALAWFQRRAKRERIVMAAIPVIIVIAVASGGGGGASALTDNSSCAAYTAASVSQEQAYVATLPSAVLSLLTQLSPVGESGDYELLVIPCADNPSSSLGRIVTQTVHP